MIDYKENWRKRLIYVCLGIISFYFGIIPISIIFQIFFSFIDHMVWVFYGFNLIKFGLLAIFLYMAFVHVKPSFVPKQKKYRRIVILVILLIPTFAIILPSGYIIQQWESGYCTISSNMFTRDGIQHKGSSTSYGASTEADCIKSCQDISNYSMDRGNSCEFTGTYGKTHWQKNSMDFTDVNEKIRFGGVK